MLKGIPISQIPSDDSPIKSTGGIRHVNKEMKAKLHKITKTNHSRFKREGSKLKSMERSLVAGAHELVQGRGSYESPVKVWSPEVIEIGSPQSEEKQDNIEQEQEIAVLDLNMEQIPRECDTDLYKIDLNL